MNEPINIKTSRWKPIIGFVCPQCQMQVGVVYNAVEGKAYCKSCQHEWEQKGTVLRPKILRPEERPAVLAKIMAPAPSAVSEVAKLRGTDEVTFGEDWQRLLNEITEAEQCWDEQDMDGFALELADIVLTVFHVASKINMDMQTALHVKHMENLKRASSPQTVEPETPRYAIFNYCDNCDMPLPLGTGKNNHTGQLLCEACFIKQGGDQ